MGTLVGTPKDRSANRLGGAKDHAALASLACITT